MGVSHTADVYFDDEFVVHHYNAYTPFEGQRETHDITGFVSRKGRTVT